MKGYNLLINGEMVAGTSTMPVLNPATEEVLTDCPRSSEEQLNEAVQAAKNAFSSWSQTQIQERKEIVLKIADIVEANAQELAQILT